MGLCLCVGACLCLTSAAAIVAFANYCVCSYEDMIKDEEKDFLCHFTTTPVRQSSVIISKTIK
jgi:hypothetical protein